MKESILFNQSRRDFLKLIGSATLAAQFPGFIAMAQSDIPDISHEDHVFIANEDSNTISVINPLTNTINTTINTNNGPSHVWFSADGRIAFVASQKVSKIDIFIDIFKVNQDSRGYSRPERIKTIDITEQDKFGFTPFLKTSPDGKEVWFSHKLADAVSVRSTEDPFGLIDYIPLEKLARPNHLEFVENKNGKVVYVSFARVDDGGPDSVASSQIAIIDRSGPSGKRKVIKTFFSRGREAHGLWTNPTNKLLYIAHEQDELPQTPNEGQTVATAFDVSDPFNPKFIAQIPLGSLKLLSGELRNKKSINLVYVRPNYKGQTA
jgi:YVTN family beta-propeller protein